MYDSSVADHHQASLGISPLSTIETFWNPLRTFGKHGVQ